MKIKPYLASKLNLWGTTKLRKCDTGSKLNECVNDCYMYNLKLTKPHKNHIKIRITTFSNQQSSNNLLQVPFFLQ
jgi:hypothetical protein